MPTIRVLPKKPLSTSCRVVMTLGPDKVIKFGCPLNSATGGQNRVEAMNWEKNKLHPLAKRHLARVYAYAENGAWLIMERLTVAAPRNRRLSEPMEDELKDALHQMGIDYGDMWSNNWMTGDDGQAVAIDYGYEEVLFGQEERAACGECEWCRQMRCKTCGYLNGLGQPCIKEECRKARRNNQ